MAYLDSDAFKGLTLAPADYVDEIETREPGWIDSQLAYWSSFIDTRLRKRYAAPFATPYPVAVTGWLARIVTLRVYLKRGVDPTDEQFALVREDSAAVLTELREAADSDTGLFDLPLRADTTVTGIDRGGPLAYTEVSPYTWGKAQQEAAEDE